MTIKQIARKLKKAFKRKKNKNIDPNDNTTKFLRIKIKNKEARMRRVSAEARKRRLNAV